MRIIRNISVFCLCVLIWGCGLNGEQTKAVNDAVKALREIDAATQVGVNYPKYGELMIVAKAKVNEAERVLPEGELRTALHSTMATYEEASQNWTDSINASSRTIAGLDEQLDKQRKLRENWRVAREHLEKVSKLID